MKSRVFGIVDHEDDESCNENPMQSHEPARREPRMAAPTLTAVKDDHAGESNPEHGEINRKSHIREPVLMVRQHQVRGEVPPPRQCRRILSTSAAAASCMTSSSSPATTGRDEVMTTGDEASLPLRRAAMTCHGLSAQQQHEQL